MFFRDVSFCLRGEIEDFCKKNAENVCGSQILCIFAPANEQQVVGRWKISIGLWCNGNTTDSGPVIPGSNPGSPTNLPYLSQKIPESSEAGCASG